MSIGYGWADVKDPEEVGYHSRIGPKVWSEWERRHTCTKCGGHIKWITRRDGKRILVDLKRRPGGKFLYRPIPDGSGRWGQSGSGPGYAIHVCKEPI